MKNRWKVDFSGSQAPGGHEIERTIHLASFTFFLPWCASPVAIPPSLHAAVDARLINDEICVNIDAATERCSHIVTFMHCPMNGKYRPDRVGGWNQSPNGSKQRVSVNGGGARH